MCVRAFMYAWFSLDPPRVAAEDNYDTILSQFGFVTTNQISQWITWIRPAAVEGKTSFAVCQMLSALLYDAEKKTVDLLGESSTGKM